MVNCYMTDQQSEPDQTQEQSNKSLDEAKETNQGLVKRKSKKFINKCIQWMPLGGSGIVFSTVSSTKILF